MTKKRRAAAYQELRLIARRHRGLLRPHDVVEYARNRRTALHDYFTWDDSKAAHEYRLWQARQLIRVAVTVLTPEVPKPARIYVSLRSDRARDAGGYRLTADVLSDSDRREQLLAEALADLQTWQEKYRLLADELAPVFAAATRLRKRQAAS